MVGEHGEISDRELKIWETGFLIQNDRITRDDDKGDYVGINDVGWDLSPLGFC